MTGKDARSEAHCGTGTLLKGTQSGAHSTVQDAAQRNIDYLPTAVVSNMSVTIQKRLTLALYTVNSTKIAWVYASSQVLS